MAATGLRQRGQSLNVSTSAPSGKIKSSSTGPVTSIESTLTQYIQYPTLFGILPIAMKAIAQVCSGDFLVVYFGVLYWNVNQAACVRYIWLVPVVEIACGFLKWYFGHPRPIWCDEKITMRAASHEFSFPSSHSMMSFALAVDNFRLVIGFYPAQSLALCIAVSRVCASLKAAADGKETRH